MKRRKEIKLRLTDKEFAALADMVQQSGLSRNAFLVRMIKQQTIYPVDTLSKTNEMLAALLAQLRGMATNMNQVAKIANSRQEVPSINYLRYILAAVQNLKEESQPVFTSLREALHGNR